MKSYPTVDQLPDVIVPRCWQWRPFEGTSADGKGFFIGTDEAGDTWFTKMHGSFYGYRELVFERLVQRAGWPCQSSSFAILEYDSLPRRTNPGSESVQLVTRLLAEHGSDDCGPTCPIAPLRGDRSCVHGDPIQVLATSGLEDALNVARADILGPLLGGK